MLKRALIVALALMFVVGLSGMALAVSNTSTIDQNGILNDANVLQHDAVNTNLSYIRQWGDYNDADLHQHGTSNWNDSYIFQGVATHNNMADVDQRGTGSTTNTSTIDQWGHGHNSATVDQWGTSNVNVSDIDQNGNSNIAVVDQN